MRRLGRSRGPGRVRRLVGALALAAALTALLAGAVQAAQDATGGDFQVSDTDGDGIPEPPEGFPGDLDVAPGEAVSAELQEALEERAAEIEAEGGAFIDGICGGWAVSYGPDETVIDAIYKDRHSEAIIDWAGDDQGEPGLTASNPFRIHTEGEVVYYGELENAAGEGPANHTWFIKTGGFSLDSGGDDNPDLNNRNAGSLAIDANLPVALTGTVKVTGDLDSENGADCSGSGFVRFEGPNPITTPAGAAGAALGVIGGIGLLFNARPAVTWRA